MLQSPFFAVFAAFVAINTVIHAALALATVLPTVYVSDLWASPTRRQEDRGIDTAADGPGVPSPGPSPEPSPEPRAELAGTRAAGVPA